MELDELKKLWMDENERLKNKIEVNEKILKEMNMNKAIGEIDPLFKKAILGRNLALVYCLISMVAASLVIQDVWYSIPSIIGGLIMLRSFIYHLSIDKPDYYSMPILDLQKSINDFRIHIASSEKNDMASVIVWQLVTTPACLRLRPFNIFIYDNPKYLAIFCLYMFVFAVLTIAFSKKAYKKGGQQLKKAESHLNEIKEFEK